MDKDKLDRLLKDGWKVGTVSEFLGLSKEEISIELKLQLRDRIKQGRKNQN
jgi:hypothetical protein